MLYTSSLRVWTDSFLIPSSLQISDAAIATCEEESDLHLEDRIVLFKQISIKNFLKKRLKNFFRNKIPQLGEVAKMDN